MKTQLTKPARSKARYTEEYKKEALELWRASGRSAAKVGAELVSARRCSIAGPSWSASPSHSGARSSLDAVSQNWKRRFAACVQRTPNF